MAGPGWGERGLAGGRSGGDQERCAFGYPGMGRRAVAGVCPRAGGRSPGMMGGGGDPGDGPKPGGDDPAGAAGRLRSDLLAGIRAGSRLSPKYC